MTSFGLKHSSCNWARGSRQHKRINIPQTDNRENIQIQRRKANKTKLKTKKQNKYKEPPVSQTRGSSDFIVSAADFQVSVFSLSACHIRTCHLVIYQLSVAILFACQLVTHKSLSQLSPCHIYKSQ